MWGWPRLSTASHPPPLVPKQFHAGSSASMLAHVLLNRLQTRFPSALHLCYIVPERPLICLVKEPHAVPLPRPEPGRLAAGEMCGWAGTPRDNGLVAGWRRLLPSPSSAKDGKCCPGWLRLRGGGVETGDASAKLQHNPVCKKMRQSDKILLATN